MKNRLLAAILIGYVVLATTYSVVSPLFEVSDELWHYPMVKYIADNGSLPVQDAGNIGAWRQEGSQPPLYYMIGAALTFWIDTSDLEQVRQVNPHSNIGVILPDRNANMMVHRPDLERFPWGGTALAVHLVRFLSVALGAGTVYVTYLLGRELFPDWEAVGLLAAALVAFLPMFLFIHGSVNNDALSNLLGNLITLLLVRLLRQDTAPTTRQYVVLGLVVGAGLLSKGSIGFMTVIVAAVLLILSVRYRDWRPFIIGGVISGGLANLIAAWWYIRNWRLYGDPTGLNRFLDIVGRRLIPANAEQLWAERFSFLQAYWGFFGGVNVPLPDWTYTGFNIVGGVALISAVVYLIGVAARRAKHGRWWLMVAVTLVWIAITFVSYVRWTAITPASQGRLVFVALSSISVWMAVGLLWPFRAWGRYALGGGVVGYFAAVALMAPFVVIRPMYTPPPPPETVGQAQVVFAPADAPGAVGLLAAGVQTDPVQPGGFVHLNTHWQLTEAFDRNWSLFVHLETDAGVIVAQRDVYPGQGLFGTSNMEPGRAWVNPLVVDIPRGVYAPSALNVMVGWYHLETGERMRLNHNSDERVQVGTVAIEPLNTDSSLPNPININFDNRIALVGYEYSTLTPRQGEEMTVTLYWQAQEAIPEDFVVFVHVIQGTTFSIVGGSDAQPVGWTRPTSTWEVGEIIEDRHTFTINADADPLPYEVEIGFYNMQDGDIFDRLRVVTPDGGMANNYFYLSRVRVLPAQAGQ